MTIHLLAGGPFELGRVHLLPRQLKVVVVFGLVERQVSGITEKFGHGANALGQRLLDHRPMLMKTESCLHRAGDQRRPSRRADGSRHEGALKHDAVSCKGVDIGCLRQRVAVTAEPIAHVVDVDPKHIGSFGGGTRLANPANDRQEQRKVVQKTQGGHREFLSEESRSPARFWSKPRCNATDRGEPQSSLPRVRWPLRLIARISHIITLMLPTTPAAPRMLMS